MSHKVIIGDGEHQREEKVELKKVNYGNGDRHRWFLGDTEFDGHHVLWGFEYFPTNYRKSSELSGDEYRKGGEIRYYMNRKQVLSEFCRDPQIAALKIGQTLLRLQEFHWETVITGRVIYYDDVSCRIGSIFWDQGCMMIETTDGKAFPKRVWEEDGEYERESRIKVEILSPNIWWYEKK